MKPQFLKVIFAVLLILPSLVVSAEDDGTRCAICGKLTFRGGSHICMPRKKTPSVSVYVSHGRKYDKASDCVDEMPDLSVSNEQTSLDDMFGEDVISSVSRIWTDEKGRKLDASWLHISKDFQHVFLKSMRTKKRLDVRLSQLSEEDRKYVVEYVKTERAKGNVWSHGVFKVTNKSLSFLPKSIDGWKWGTLDSDKKGTLEFVECVYPDDCMCADSLKPIRIRIFSNDECLYRQADTNGDDTCIFFENGSKCVADNNKPCYGVYIALLDAVKKAREWRETAAEHSEEVLVKEVALQHAPSCVSFVVKGGAICKESFVARSKFRIWVMIMTRGMHSLGFLMFGHSSNRLVVNLDYVDAFLKTSNPSGAIEVLQRYKDLYK